MCEIQVKNSSSGSSTNSWTFLDDDSLLKERQSSEQNGKQEVHLEMDTEDKAPEQCNTKPTKNRSDGFLTFDEYLQEHLLQHDYEFNEKPQKLKALYKNKDKREARKCKARHMGITVFLVLIFTLTGFATLSSIFSQPVVEVRNEEETQQRTVSIENDSLYKNSVIEEINKTLKEIQNIQELEAMANNKVRNDSEFCIPPVIGPKLMDKNKVVEKPRSLFTAKHKLSSIRDLVRANRSRPNNAKNKWLALKELLLNTNIHALVSLIMTNVYLFTLLVDLTKRHDVKERNNSEQKLLDDLIKNNNAEELKKYLLKELPFYNEDETDNKEKSVKKSKKSGKVKRPSEKIPALTKTTTTTTNITNEDREEMKKMIFDACPFLSRNDSKSFNPLVTHPISQEFGKSECERRFDELDLYQKKFDSLKQTQRDKIKLLKQKFRNEVSFIRDTEEESDARAEKINKTSQKFIRKLKSNREKYLLELRKVRELRQRAANVNKMINQKDACVGNYTPSIPSCYNFGQNVEKMKKVFEERTELQLSNEWRFH